MRPADTYTCVRKLSHFLNKCRFIVNLAYFDILIRVGLWSVCCQFVIGLSSGLSVCCRLQFQHCANDRFSIGVMSVMYRSQIGLFHTESYPKWPRHEPNCFYRVFSNIVGGRQLADSLKTLPVLSVSCRFGRCDWGMISYMLIVINVWYLCHCSHALAKHLPSCLQCRSLSFSEALKTGGMSRRCLLHNADRLPEVS